MKLITKDIKRNGRQVELRNIWLLYNFNVYQGYFWTQRDAWNEAHSMNFNKDDTKEIFQVLRGNIKIEIHKDPFYKPKPIIVKKEEIYHCDNCGKKIDWSKGAFQCGVNKEGKTGTWCSKKCYKASKS